MNKKIILIVIFFSLLFASSCKETDLLDTPTISINGDTIIWDEVDKALTYHVFIGSNEYITDVNQYKIHEKTLGSYEVCVIASNTKSKSNESNRVIYKVTNTGKEKLDAPVIVSNNKLISWNKVTGATIYKVSINDTIIESTVNSYDLSNYPDGLYKVSVTSCNDTFQSEKSNELLIEINNSVIKLSKPIVSNHLNVITWEEVKDASEYYVYVDYDLVGITSSLSYTIEEGYGDHVVYVRAVSTKESVLASDQSDKLIVNVPVQNTPLDLSKPISFFTMSSRANPTFVDNVLTVGEKFVSLNSTSTAFMFIPEGDHYMIKLENGMYLTYTRINNVDRFISAPKTKDINQLFNLHKVDGTEFNYMLYPLSNPGYPICEDNLGGYHQYQEIIGLELSSNPQVFMLYNTEATFLDDVIHKEEEVDLSKTLVMYVDDQNKVISFNEDSLMVQGDVYSAFNDYSSVSFELIKQGDYYQIKFIDGYLTHMFVSGKDRFFKKEYIGNDTQLFKITKASNGFKIAPKSNEGYLLCEDDNNGYHQYSDCGSPKQIFIFVNVL